MQEVKRMTEEVQGQASEMTEAVEAGFEAASRSFAEANRGFQSIASEINDFSRQRFEDVLHSWQQCLSARSFGDVVGPKRGMPKGLMTPTCRRCRNSERCISA